MDNKRVWNEERLEMRKKKQNENQAKWKIYFCTNIERREKKEEENIAPHRQVLLVGDQEIIKELKGIKSVKIVMH